MTTLRKAAQQALEYLDAPSAKLWPAGTQYRIIDALRAALAEPVEYAVEPNGKRSPLLTHMMNKRTKEEGSALTEEKPVAWISIECIGERYLCFSKPLDNDPVQPLYTAPPQRKPLTDEKIVRWVASGEYNVITNDWASHIDFARAIERAHGIKENP